MTRTQSGGRRGRTVVGLAAIAVGLSLAAVPPGAAAVPPPDSPAGSAPGRLAPPGTRCDPIDPAACVLPFPNDFFTVADATTDTGRRVAFAADALPANVLGTHVDPTEWNRNDGFSPGSAIMTRVPGLDLAATGAAPITDIGASLADDAPIVLLDADTGERHPYWAELDARAPADRQLLIVRPATNLAEGHRYVVGLRDLRTSSGTVIEAPAEFAALVSGRPATNPALDRRRTATKRVLADLERAGVRRHSLYLAWDFTVASERSLSERALSMRDRSFAELGDDAPAFTVTSVEEQLYGRVVRGRIAAPSFLGGTGAPGSRLGYGPDGLPAPSGATQTTAYTCLLPPRALDEPVDPVLYGHGLLGSPNEVTAGNIRQMTARGFGYCATQWIGMANEDVPFVATVLQDFSRFPAIPDRLQQSFVQFLHLGRAMTHPDGLVSHPAFRDAADGSPLLDVYAELSFDGNSQGGILGGALTAVAQDFTHSVLGVTGMNYSTLLDRSVDFEPFRAVFHPSYPDPLDRQLVLSLAQMLWDRGESNGYAAHLTDDPLPGTPAHRVLMHVAYGDHQVAPVTAEVKARTAAVPVRAPALAPGRSPDVEPLWGIPAIPSYPHEGSALVLWDFGTPTPPLVNLPPFPPQYGTDPHGLPRAHPAAQEQKDVFLRTGTVVDTCGEVPCPPPS